jgi:large subunit ribosomal protein L37e
VEAVKSIKRRVPGTGRQRYTKVVNRRIKNHFRTTIKA